MTPELTALALAGLLQMVQILLMAVPANLEIGSQKLAGPRDEPGLMAGVSKGTGRLIRATTNHYEALILFTIAVVVVTLGPGSTPLTSACAWAYLAARLLYIPAYRFGWAPWRSVIWAVGWLATGLMLLAALIGG